MKIYTVKINDKNSRTTSGTLEELKKYFSYTLLCGSEYEKSINANPKTIKSLISNVNKSYDAIAANGYSDKSIELID
jgi:hypothetical protein